MLTIFQKPEPNNYEILLLYEGVNELLYPCKYPEIECRNF